MNTPSDFPDLDLEAWRKALPMPDPQADATLAAAAEAFAVPADVVNAPTPSGVARLITEPPPFALSPIERRGIRRRKEKP